MVDAYLIEEIILDLAERANKSSDLSDREDVPEHGQFFYEGKSVGLNLAIHVIRSHLAKVDDETCLCGGDNVVDMSDAHCVC